MVGCGGVVVCVCVVVVWLCARAAYGDGQTATVRYVHTSTYVPVAGIMAMATHT